jgi:ribose transport system substrate-binding protein
MHSRKALGSGIALLGAATLIGASACGSTSNASGDAGSGPVNKTGLKQAQTMVSGELKAPTKIMQTAPLPHAPPKGKLLIYLEQGAVPSNVFIGQSEGQAAKAIGWQFQTINYDPTSPSSLQSAFSTALTKHASVVSLTASDPSTYGASTLAAYKKAGVPIVVDGVASVPKSPVLIGESGGAAAYTHSAQTVAAWVVADSKGHGNVVEAYVPSFSVTNVWGQAFKAEFKKLCPSCGLVTAPISVDQATNGQEATVLASVLRRNPSYKYLVFDDGSFSSGINAALTSAGLTGIKIAGSNFQPENAAALKAGTQSAWTGDNLQEIGYGSVDYAIRHFEGVPLTKGNDNLPTQILTKNTIGNLQRFTQPADALQQYERLWKVPVTK